jgi:hypothetical protein
MASAHGDRAKYIAGCRCGECREANANYQRAYRRGEKGSHGDRITDRMHRYVSASNRPDDMWPRPGLGSIWGKLPDDDE